jgi:hypothetical protein
MSDGIICKLNSEELRNEVNILLPLIEVLKSTEESIINIEIVEGSGPSEKLALLKSTIDQLTGQSSQHIASIAAYLLRELLTRFTKDLGKKVTKSNRYEYPLYTPGSIPEKELHCIENITNPKFSFERPGKIVWTGEMEEVEKQELLNYSDHPFWVVAIFRIFDARRSTMGTQALNDSRIQNFLDLQKTKFTLSTNDYPTIVSHINNLLRVCNRIVHNPAKYRPIGEIIINNQGSIPNELQQDFKDFKELITSFGSLMENFKLKPIGRLDQLDEIINE